MKADRKTSSVVANWVIERSDSRTAATTHAGAIAQLLELIAALDRRVPQAHRRGEASIVRDAARLRSDALRRIQELQNLMGAGDG